MRAISDIGDPRLVKALAHPLRVQILSVLEDRISSPSDLAEELGAPLGNVSYHVRTLSELGLLELVRRRTRRGAVESYYRATGRATVTDSAWSQVPSVVRKSMVGVALQQAIEQASTAAARGGFDRDESSLTTHSVTLDASGVEELRELLERVNAEVGSIQARSTERIERGGSDPRPVGVVTMLFGTDGSAAGADAAA